MTGIREDTRLPSLSHSIQIYKAASSPEGEPRWTLHQKISNRYFNIGWAEFECLARFHRCKTVAELKAHVESETTLKIDEEDIQKLIVFLQANGLVVAGDQIFTQRDIQKAATPRSLWIRILHGYLYFTLPLFKPEAFLKRTLPHVEIVFSRRFLQAAFALLALGAVLTLQRPDEFVHTFTQLFTLEGAILTLVTFTLIKILHELGHAYAAVRNGVSVPHMGVAFIVLYPMLYTETTAAWQLSSPRKRMEIALAGVTAELMLAAVFLLLWNILPGGILRSLCFNVVAVSLLGSLLINMNPLMRFDGYYVLSDFLGLENLHQRAIGFARWALRRLLFGLQDPEPFDAPPARKKFLILFGLAVLIYRFFLFFGIALLVYHLFFKPLGLLLMLVEIGFFIALPIWSEIRVWWKRREEILRHRRARILSGFCIALLLLSVAPVDTTVSAPAMLHASDYHAFYSPAVAVIVDLPIREGRRVSKGEILVRLESPILEYEWLKTKTKLGLLETIHLRSQTDAALYKERAGKIEQELASTRAALNALEEQKALLILRAPFDGIIRDLSPEMQTGRAVKTSDLLFRLLEPSAISVTGFIRESDFERLKIGGLASFRPASALFGGRPLKVEKLEPLNTQNLAWPELASVYKGPIPAAFSQKGEVMPLDPLYTAHLAPLNNSNTYQGVAVPGRIHIRASSTSFALSAIRQAFAFLWREINLNQ